MIYLKNRELDKLVAEHIFGWADFSGKHDFLYGCPPSFDDVRREVPHYSTNLQDTWEIVEELKNAGLKIAIYIDADITTCHITDAPSSFMTVWEVEADTPQLAICLAALKALGVDME